jgi:hypothetical protein
VKAALTVGDEDGVHRGFQGGGLEADLLLGPPPLRDVAGNPEQLDNPAGRVAHGGNPHLSPDGGPVLARQLEFQGSDALRIGGARTLQFRLFGESLPDVLKRRRRQSLCRPLSEHLFDRVPAQAEDRGADVLDAETGRERPDHIGDVLGQEPVAPLAVPERCLRSLPLAAVAGCHDVNGVTGGRELDGYHGLRP